jgi:non-ribosomal peptide synthetase-like protein
VWLVPGVLVAGVVFAGVVVVTVRVLSIGLDEGVHPVRSRVGWQAWTIERLLDSARTILFPLYSSLFTPVWLRLLGAQVGRDVEASTVLLLPSLTRIEDGAFLADDTMVASYELHGGWMRLGPVRIGKRAFLGNSGMAAPGHRVPRDGLVAVLSAAPAKAKPGSSWLGSPAVRLRRRTAEGDESRTYQPPAACASRGRCGSWDDRAGRGHLCVGPARRLHARRADRRRRLGGAILLSGIVMLAAGAVAAGISTAAKWLIVGPIRAGEQPLWSSFVWRTEVSDTFTEMVAAPWFARAPPGRPRWRCGCVRWAPRSVAASGATATGCRSPTSSPWATGRRSTGDASCRRTCSMIES